jgi:hypothetical protein
MERSRYEPASRLLCFHSRKKAQAFAADLAMRLSSKCGLAASASRNLPNVHRPLVSPSCRWDTGITALEIRPLVNTF